MRTSHIRKPLPRMKITPFRPRKEQSVPYRVVVVLAFRERRKYRKRKRGIGLARNAFADLVRLQKAELQSWRQRQHCCSLCLRSGKVVSDTAEYRFHIRPGTL